MQALKKEILELTVEFLKPLTERESTNLAKQQQPKSIADLDRLCSLSLHGCSCFGCLQNTPQLATLSSLTRLVNARWQCVVVSTFHKMLIDMVILLCAGNRHKLQNQPTS